MISPLDPSTLQPHGAGLVSATRGVTSSIHRPLLYMLAESPFGPHTLEPQC